MVEENIKRGRFGTFEGDPNAEEEDTRDKITVSLGPEDRARLDALKAAWDYKSDSRALKLALEVGKNAIFALLSAETMRRLADRERVRASDYNRDGARK